VVSTGPVTRVQAPEVVRLGIEVLRAARTPLDNALIQVQQLVEADLCGRPSHGMQRLPTLVARIANGVLDPRAAPVVEVRAPSMILIDGRSGLGPLAAHAAVDELLRAAGEAGIAIATIRGAGHLGMLAPYVERLASEGLVGIGLTTSEALVHPAGGRVALIGTNPIAIGIPAEPHPFVLDMSTAAISAGEVMAHADRGQPLRDGCAVDGEGRPTNDPAAALEGAISPFGGPKGYGLGLGIELVVALLTDTGVGTDVRGTLDTDRLSTKGDVFIAIHPDRLGGSAAGERLTGYLDSLRISPPAPGFERVLIPGDRMREERRRRGAEGIAYPAAVWRRLVELREQPQGAGRV
jgi:L-2-hydroxycarboxylate dehydrogenase (NAD+)